MEKGGAGYKRHNVLGEDDEIVLYPDCGYLTVCVCHLFSNCKLHADDTSVNLIFQIVYRVFSILKFVLYISLTFFHCEYFLSAYYLSGTVLNI